MAKAASTSHSTLAMPTLPGQSASHLSVLQDADIHSLCPLNASVPIVASGIIPVSESDVANIPSIALSIPDFEGQAILRIFANSTETEIGCYSAVVTNGATFSQPSSVGTVLGVFALISVIASFATAAYGDSVPIMRTHYAHSVSVMVVFAVFQHIFFTGALSMNWPSVLVAWWSNFAWAGGMIHSTSMQTSINKLIGNNLGNTSEVGAAGAGTAQESLGGGYDISAIYKRSLTRLFTPDIASDIYQRDHSQVLRRDVYSRSLEHALQRRALANASDGYKWYGHPVGNGLPLPGNYSGFAGTLAEEGIRVSNAFMTGFLWFLILFVIVVAAVVAFKWILEAFVAMKALRSDRLSFFRKHWLGYVALTALRTCYIAFFMIMFLTMFQFSYDSSGGVKAVAGLVFVIFLVGIAAVVAYAYFYRISSAEASPPYEDQTELEPKTGIKNHVARLLPSRTKSVSAESPPPKVSLWTLSVLGDEPRPIHEDEDYTRKFGWLAARFRRTRWWFFGAWTLYELVRACFYAGASGHPMTQVFGLLVVEILAFAGIIWARPFEGRRLNVLVVYMLGFSKVASVALSAAFDVSFNLPRITTTVIGVVIIVIQGILTIVTLIAIFVGAISSYMSMTRNRDDFRPRKWHAMREKYFDHLGRAATDLPPPPPPPPAIPEEPRDPYFSVGAVRRLHKIEDDDKDFVAEVGATSPYDPEEPTSYTSLNQQSTPNARAAEKAPAADFSPRRRSRTASMHSASNLPFGARAHRPSWTSRDFGEWSEESNMPINMSMQLDDEEGCTIANNTAAAATARTTSPRPTRAATLQNPKLRPAASADDLVVGGAGSNHDSIGRVPSPTVRPRSGTWNSRSGSASGTVSPSRNGTPNGSIRHGIVGVGSIGAQLEVADRNSRMMAPLTPAQEKDEEFARFVAAE